MEGVKQVSTFSVIVPIYHGEHYVSGIVSQIESCKEYLEDEDSIEVLLVNDAPDLSLGMEWKSKTIDVVVMNTNQNLGIHGARVRGLEQCTGDYILFLDQDDKIAPNYFSSQLQRLGAGGAVVCKALNGGQNLYIDNQYFPNIPCLQFMLKEWNLILSPGQVLIRKEFISATWVKNVLKKNGADDWFLWICMLAEGCVFSLNDEVLYEHMLHDSNASGDTMGMLQSEQEMMELIYRHKVLSDYDFGLLLKGSYKRNKMRILKLDMAKKKLDWLTEWFKLKENNVYFDRYLLYSGFRRIAIYGCGIIGEYLYSELKELVDVKCFIDRNADHIQKKIPVYTLSDQLPEIDCVILTLMGETKDVERELKEKGIESILLIKDWINYAEKSDF